LTFPLRAADDGNPAESKRLLSPMIPKRSPHAQHLPTFSLVVCAGVLAALTASLAAADSGAAKSPAGLLLVANKGDHTLSLVDVTSGHQLAALPEDGVTGHEVAASPDGRLAFVPIYGDSGVGKAGTDGQLIRVIDLQKRAITGTIDFGKGVRPHCAVFGPSNGLLYVTTELEKAVAVIDPRTLKIVASIPTGAPQSHMLAISHDGRRGFTSNVGAGSVSVLDLDNNKLLATIPVAAMIQRISISTDDRWVFTADQTALRLAVIDTSTNEVSASIPLPGLGFGTATTPGGRWLLVTLPALNQIGLVDLTTMKVTETLAVPKAPQEILVAADGATAYVSCDASKQVAVIDLKTWHVARLIDVGAVADGLAWAKAN
jgi:YVTN family beta-propeller protein